MCNCFVTPNYKGVWSFLFLNPLAASWGFCSVFCNAYIKSRCMGYNFRFLRYMYLCLLFNFAELLGHAWIYMSRMHARLCGWVILCTQTFPVKVLDSKDTLISSILYWLISGPCTLKTIGYANMCATM